MILKLNILLLAPSPDLALLYKFWNVEHAPSYDEASDDFPTGFRETYRRRFRWICRIPGDPSEVVDVRLVPISPPDLLGPPCAWDAQDEGKVKTQKLHLQSHK